MYFDTQVRIKRGHRTQYAFAKAVDMHETDVSKVLSGRRPLSEKDRAIWAKELNCKPEDVLKQ